MRASDKLEQFKGGWLIGAFDPALVSTRDVEVGIKKVAKGNAPDGHYHKIATGSGIILEGKAEDQGRIFSAGDIITLRPLQRNNTVFLEDSLILCIKAPWLRMINMTDLSPIPVHVLGVPFDDTVLITRPFNGNAALGTDVVQSIGGIGNMLSQPAFAGFHFRIFHAPPATPAMEAWIKPENTAG